MFTTKQHSTAFMHAVQRHLCLPHLSVSTYRGVLFRVQRCCAGLQRVPQSGTWLMSDQSAYCALPYGRSGRPFPTWGPLDIFTHLHKPTFDPIQYTAQMNSHQQDTHFFFFLSIFWTFETPSRPTVWGSLPYPSPQTPSPTLPLPFPWLSTLSGYAYFRLLLLLLWLFVRDEGEIFGKADRLEAPDDLENR